MPLAPLLAMAVAAAALFAFSRLLAAAPCWAVVLMAAAIAWPMWVGQREYALFQHRLALGAATIVASRIRRWLWRGRLTSIAQAFSAFFWAVVLLAIAPLLHAWHIGLLATDVVLLALFERAARRLLQADVRAEYVGLLARRWVLLVANVAFLAISFFVIDYFLVGAPDTRALDWNAVASRAYAEYGGAACPLAGMVVGSLNAVDRLNWHAAEVLIPGLPSAGLKLVAWLVFLLQAGAVSFAYTRYLLGAFALADKPSDGITPASIAAIAAALLLGTWALRDFDPARVKPVAQALVHRLDPCRIADSTIAAERKAIDARIAVAAAADREHMARRVDQELDPLFARVERGVDGYLDWYFSVAGEYQRIAAQLFARSTNELEERLFLATRTAEALTEANQRIAAQAAPQLTALTAQLGTRLRTQAASQPCWRQTLDLPKLPGFERDVMHASVSIGSGFVVGAATTRLAARRVSQVAAARLAGRVAGKRVASTVASAGVAATVCAPGGPLAILCGLVTGAVAWVTVDKAMVMVDELRFREEMRAEILAAVRGQKAQLAREMRAAYGLGIDAAAKSLHVAVNGVFIPARDGR